MCFRGVEFVVGRWLFDGLKGGGGFLILRVFGLVGLCVVRESFIRLVSVLVWDLRSCDRFEIGVFVVEDEDKDEGRLFGRRGYCGFGITLVFGFEGLFF